MHLFKLCLAFLWLTASSQLLMAQEVETIEDAINNVQLLAPTISVDNPLESSPEQVDLAWDSMDDASGYYFELCLDNECAEVYYPDKVIEAKIILKDLDPQQYFWRVHALNSAGEIGKATLPQPLIINPAVVEASKDLSDQQAQSQSRVSDEPESILDLIKKIPWYVLILMTAYLVYLLKLLAWLLNK